MSFGNQAMIIVPLRRCLPAKLCCHSLREDCQSRKFQPLIKCLLWYVCFSQQDNLQRTSIVQMKMHTDTQTFIPSIISLSRLMTSCFGAICSSRMSCQRVGNQLPLKSHSVQAGMGSFQLYVQKGNVSETHWDILKTWGLMIYRPGKAQRVPAQRLGCDSHIS